MFHSYIASIIVPLLESATIENLYNLGLVPSLCQLVKLDSFWQQRIAVLLSQHEDLVQNHTQ